MTTENPQLHSKLLIASAEERDAATAPPDYRPHWDNGPCVTDEEISELEPIPAWRRYFAGGSNRPHFVLVNDVGEAVIVEHSGPGGRYSAYQFPAGDTISEEHNNAYDAFWAAEQCLGVSTDPALSPPST